jgi:hypothetical protein
MEKARAIGKTRTVEGSRIFTTTGRILFYNRWKENFGKLQMYWPSWLCSRNPSPPPRCEAAFRCCENQVMWYTLDFQSHSWPHTFSTAAFGVLSWLKKLTLNLTINPTVNVKVNSEDDTFAAICCNSLGSLMFTPPPRHSFGWDFPRLQVTPSFRENHITYFWLRRALSIKFTTKKEKKWFFLKLQGDPPRANGGIEETQIEWRE